MNSFHAYLNVPNEKGAHKPIVGIIQRDKGLLYGVKGEYITSCIVLAKYTPKLPAIDGFHKGRLRADVYAIYKGQPYHGFIGDWNWNESVSMRRVKRFPKGVVL